MAVVETLEKVRTLGEKHPYIIKGAVLLTGIAAVTNHFGGEMVWKSGPNEIVALPYDGPPTRTIGLAVPGFGSLGGVDMAKRMQQTPFGDQPWFYCQYDNKRGTDNKIHAVHLIEKQQELGFEGMDVYAPSMGFIHALEIARMADIPMRNVLITGTPSHIRDARAGWLGYAVAKTIPYDFRLAGKFASTMIADTSREGVRKTWSNLKHSARETFRGSSPMLLRDQLKFLGRMDILQNWRDYDRVIIPGYTKIGHAAPLDTSDTTVYTGRARPGIEQFASNFWDENSDVPVTFIPLPDGAGHANTRLTIEVATQWMEQVRETTENIVYRRKPMV